LGYSSLKDFFPTMDIKPNPGCPNPMCKQLQTAYTMRYNSAEAVAARAAAAAASASAAEQEVPVHEDNDWGIQVVAEPETGPGDGSTSAACIGGGPSGKLADGLEYSMPVS
jgi:ubiquitin-like modifier-activating enzyme 5